MPAVIETQKAVRDQLRQKELDEKRLLLTAPRSGTVLPPPLTAPPHHKDNSDGRLPSWTGTPLDPENLRAYLKEGVLFCQVGDPQQLEAILVIDQADMEFLYQGQAVDLKLDSLPHDMLKGTIDRISESNLKITPLRMRAKSGGDLPSKTDPATGLERPQTTSYQARVSLDDPDRQLRMGLRGQAKIHARWMSLSAQALAVGGPHLQLQALTDCFTNSPLAARNTLADGRRPGRPREPPALRGHSRS